MSEPTERPRCPDCRMPHDLTPGSPAVAACASILASIAADDFERWTTEVTRPPAELDRQEPS